MTSDDAIAKALRQLRNDDDSIKGSSDKRSHFSYASANEEN
ncbi:MAG: hypothetical protein Q8L56_00850 [Rhodocyclaceae bacterium]|nr:hypothetical protein [Rhodocyclaceae bacterium]